MKQRQSEEIGTNRLKNACKKDYNSIHTKMAISDCNHEKRLQKLCTRIKSDDTVIRQEVHAIIVARLNEGKGKLEILNELIEKYPDSSIRRYFGQYIEDHARKLNSKIQKEEEER